MRSLERKTPLDLRDCLRFEGEEEEEVELIMQKTVSTASFWFGCRFGVAAKGRKNNKFEVGIRLNETRICNMASGAMS